MKTLKDYALFYASLGLRVFPLFPRSKDPAVHGGFHRATTDGNQVAAWWNAHPNDNIGVATGGGDGLAGIVCIDLDCKKAGENGAETLRLWEEENGKLPPSWEAITGTGSIHRYYSYDPFREVIGTINHGKIFKDIDIHGDGSYMVMAPSIVTLDDGGISNYVWEASSNPEDGIALTEADSVVLSFIHEAFSDLESGDRAGFSLPEIIPEGSRNRTLFRAAASMQSKGFSDRAIRSAIEIENEERCETPLSDKEIRVIVDSVLKRYPKGGAEAWQKHQLELLNQEEKLLRQKKQLLESQT